MCSLIPIAKLPRPSNDLPLRPRKSFTRGRAIVVRRSTNSYMRSRRRVTLAPIVMPSRSLKLAIDLRDLVSSGFWPEMAARSARAERIFLESATASPTPMLITTLSSAGTCMPFVYLNCSVSLERIELSYSDFRRGVYFLSDIDVLPGALGEAHLAGLVAGSINLETD